MAHVPAVAQLVARTNDLFVEAKALYPLLGPNPIALIDVSFILVTIGQVSLVLLLGTLLFSSNVRGRNLTLLNLLAITIFVSIPPALLYYGGQILNPTPPFGLCLAQAIFNHGANAMFITASFSLIIELLIVTRLLDIRIRQSVRTVILLALPYVVFLFFAVWAGILGYHNPSIVEHQKNQLYCTISYVAFCRGIDIFNAVTVVFTIGLEIFTHIRYRQIWRNIGYGRSEENGFSTALVIRLISFTSLQLFYICLLALDFFVGSAVTHIIPIAYEALMPLATFLIFGTTKDCLEAWKMWRRKDQPTTIGNITEDPETQKAAHADCVIKPRNRREVMSII
ncbi:hypothetical protein BDW22DRAFT_40477 [Trametopsis cervina]|nr:hypothetical protein BDW22DRAFT_40477 [Trametopsis cervina]